MCSFTVKRFLRWLTSLTAILAILLLTAPSRCVAQDQDDQDDPPSRAARLSYTSGAVSFAPAGTDDWVTAVVNRPMTTGDKLWSDQDSRAELRVDAYAIRLGPMTGFSFLNLDDRTTQIRLTEGSVNVRVRRLDPDQVLEIDTPNLAFNVLRAGSYRISVNQNGDSTSINVRDGQGEVTGGGSAYSVRPGESVRFDGTDELSTDVEGYPRDDDFDRWCYDRDSRWDRAQSARYVSDDVVGYEDLDDYGGWRPVPEYGTVWFPHTTVVGWAPYRYGHWVWISPWGWTWVDDEPWGFAPFHYGRWVMVGGVWGWVPVAPRPAVVTVAYVRPVYAPALVAWVGGPHFSVSVGVGGGGVAWFPLGPRDVYCPSYHVTPRYVERVNVYNTTIINRTQVTNVYNTVYVQKNVTNINYQNQRYANAVTATSQTTFTAGQPVHRNMVRVDSREVASAQVSPLTPAVVPQQRSVVGAAAPARVRPPAQVIARPVVAKTPPPPPVAPVNQQLQKVQANGGRPLPSSQIRENDAPRNNVRVAQAARPAQLPPPGQRVTTRPNQPNQPAPAQPNANRPGQNQPPAQQNNNPPGQQNQPAPVPQNANRPPQQNQPAQAQPNNQPQPNNNRPGNPPKQPPQAQPDNRPNNNNGNFNDRPPNSRPNVNPQVQQRQQQQMDNLRKQQDQERQKLEQRQVQENQRLEQQKANQQRQQQMQQRQQQQLEQMEHKHDQQQEKMQQRQQQEIQKQHQQEQSRPPKQEKPPKQDNKDRPH